MDVPLRPSADESAGSDPAAGPWLRWVLYGLIAIGCGLRVYNVWIHNPLDHIWSDPQRYWDHAKEPLTPSPMSVFDPVVYQTWLGMVQKLTLGLPELIAIYATLLSLATPWCWYRFLREALASRTLALAGWAVLSILPTWIGIYSYFMSETLLLPLIGLSLWMTLRADRKRTVAAFLTMVALWMVTGLTRGIAIPLAAAAAGLVWLGYAQKIRTALLSVLLAGAVLLPLSFRSHHFVYLWAPYGNGWLTKIYAESGCREIELRFEREGAKWSYGFTSPIVDEQPFAPLSDWKSGRTGTVNVFVDFTQGTRDWAASLAATAQHGAARWRLHGENLAYLFFGQSWPDDNQEYFMGRMANLSRWLWAPFFVALVGLGCWRWRDTLARPLLPAVILIWFLFQGWMLVAVNEGRYRKPLEGLLVAQALVFADRARRRPAGQGPSGPATAPAELAVPAASPSIRA